MMFQETDSGQWMPLSETQRSRWFAYQSRPAGQGGHNVAIAMRLYQARGDALYMRAIRLLAARHPMLRASMRERGGQPEQTIRPDAQVAVSVVDAAALDAQALRRQVQADGARPFDLARGPLVRGHLYRCAAQELVMLVVFDHLAVDGWSAWRLMDELERILAHLDGGTQPAESAGAAAYADYVHWQRDWLATDEAARQGAYWRAALRGSLPLLGLRRHAAAPAAAATAAARHQVHTCRLPAPLVRRLKAQARLHGQTLYTLLLAGLQVLLQRYTGQSEIVIGSPMPGRYKPEWDGVAGDFVNPVALRLAADSRSTLAQLLRATRAVAMGAMAHQDYPFTRLVEELAPQRTAGVHPLFQAMFNFQNPRAAARLAALWTSADSGRRIGWGGHEAGPYPMHQSGGIGDLDLTLETLELDDEVRCDFKFAAGLMADATMARLAGHYRHVMEALAGDLAACVGDIALPLEDALAALLLGAGAVQAAPALPAHRLFERQAAASPDAPAVRDGAACLSYRELDRRANRLARQLRALGIGPEARVAVHMERGSRQLVALLAVWKAGAAYVPLDPAWPAQRVADLLADCEPEAVLTQDSLRAALPSLAQPVLALDGPDWLEAEGPEAPPQTGPESPERLAYVMYTSGSTGMPKGVMVEHGALTHLWQSLAPFVARHCPAPSNVALNAALSFDASLQSILQLLSGHTVVLVPQAIRASGDALVEFLVEQRIAPSTARRRSWS
jgi:non-ribosomal peptide synthetase component F